MADTTNPTSATPPAQNPEPAGQTQLQPAAPAARGRREPAPVRVAYTRHATAGVEDDMIVNRAWYRFLVIMLSLGGAALLLWIFYAGVLAGGSGERATSQVAPPVSVPAPQPPAPQVQASTIPPVTETAPAIPPEQQPVSPVPAITQSVVVQSTPAVQSDVQVVNPPVPKSVPRELSDAEKRDQALKERLRQKYGLGGS